MKVNERQKRIEEIMEDAGRKGYKCFIIDNKNSKACGQVRVGGSKSMRKQDREMMRWNLELLELQLVK